MKRGTLLIALAMLAFVGVIVYGSFARVSHECEVCLEFQGELVCRRGAGADELEARRAAQESTCGGNVRGMTEVIACQNRIPDRVQCSAG